MLVYELLKFLPKLFTYGAGCLMIDGELSRPCGCNFFSVQKYQLV